MSGREVRPLIADHRKVVVAEVAYSLRDLAKFLGVSYFAAQRLVQPGPGGRAPRIRSRNTGRQYMIPGAAIIDYLDGADEPMHHPESA